MDKSSARAWCGVIHLRASTNLVSETECLACLEAVIKAGEAARRRVAQIARDANR